MRVLVAGGAGFIGTNVIRRLLPLGCQIRATLHARPAVIQDTAVEYVQAELTQMDDCRRVVEGVDAVFMCAANTSGAAVMARTPMVHVTPNVVMNAQMLEAAYAATVKKFLFLSSNAAYPPSGERPIREDELLNGDPYEKYFFVGWMKRFTEVLCRMYGERLTPPMATVVLRPSNVYGPYDDFDFATSHVTAALIRRVVERHDPIVVWGTGEDLKDVLYVDDFIDAIFLAMERVSAYDPINISFGRGYRVSEILQTILEADGYSAARVEFDTSKPSMIPARLLDTTKAKAVLGFEATTSLRDGLRKTIEWYRQSRGLPREDERRMVATG